MLKCMSCHKAIVVITGGTLFSWQHIYAYIWQYIYIYIIYIYIIYIYIYIHTIILFSSPINCSISCTIEWSNWITVKIQLSFKYSEFHVNYFTIFSLITTLSTDVTKLLQCKGIFLSNVNWLRAWRLCFKSMFILVTTLGGDFRPFIQQIFL